MAKNKTISAIGDRVSDLADVGVTDIITDPFLSPENYDSTEASRLMEEFWKAYYDKTKWDQKFDQEETFYIGDREIGNIYTDSTDKDARTVFKLMFMLSEAEIDLDIPQAIFKAVEEADEEVIKALQAHCDYVLRSNEMEKINSYAERECKKYGTTIYKVLWNPNFIGAGFRGRVEVVSIHPKNILIAPGTTDIGKCDVIYHVENETLGRCIRKYGDIAKLLVGHGQPALSYWDDLGKKSLRNVNKTADVDANPNIYMHGANHPLNKFVIVERWYIDEDGDVGLQAFSGRLILARTPKFFYRRKTNPDTGEFIRDKDGNTIPIDIELVPHDYKTWIRVQDPEVQEKSEEVTKLLKETQLRRYVSHSLPFIFQYNIPRSKCPWGISNSEILYDSEQALKKMWMKHEERMLNGTTKIAYQKDSEEEAALLINNADQQLLPMKDPAGGIREINLLANDQMVVNTFQLLQDMAQKQVGISNVQQGFNENEATSGKMVAALIQQSAQKLNVKSNEKHIAYKKLYRLICDFLICFSDGTRPHRIDTGVKPVYGKFNRYDLLKWNVETEEWIYPDIDVEISEERPFPKSSIEIYNNAIQLAAGGFFMPTTQNVLLWKLLSKLRFPNADMILMDIQEQMKQMPQPGMPGMPGALGAPATPGGQPPPEGAPPPEGGQPPPEGAPSTMAPPPEGAAPPAPPEATPPPPEEAPPPPEAAPAQGLPPEATAGAVRATPDGTQDIDMQEVIARLPEDMRRHFNSLSLEQQHEILKGED